MKKLKINLYKKFSRIVAIATLCFTNCLFAQEHPDSLWKAIGKDTVSTKKNVIIDQNLSLKGGIKTDSMRVLGTLAVGEHSLYLNGSVQGGSGSSFDQIQSSSGIIAFGNRINADYSNIRIGIGTKNPQSRLHLNSEDDEVPILKITATQSTGNNFNDGFDIQGGEYVTFKQWEDKPMIFYKMGVPHVFIDAEMVSGNQEPRFGITRSNSIFDKALTYLHLGKLSFSGNGYRTWMEVGTLCSSKNPFAEPQNMYAGLMNGSSDAIVNWGTQSAGTTSSNRLRFLFTTQSGGIAAQTNGLELSRMISKDGNRGLVGIGNFAAANIDPRRRLEVLDNGENAPQFRLTHTQNSNINQGVFTDFQTTSAGNLFINPINNNVSQKVGINISSPKKKLDILDNTAAQLRLTHTAAANSTQGTYTDLQTTGAGDLYINPSSNSISQKVGISIAAPQRKLDVLDGSNAQLRLTSALATPANVTVFTDFRTTGSGDLLINPTGSSGKGGGPPSPIARSVGINLSVASPPTQTLDVNGNMRARTLPANGNKDNTLTKMVVVDNNGVFHWREAGSIGGGGGFSTCGSATPLTGNSEIALGGNNFVFSGTGNVGIGTTCTPLAKLHVMTQSATGPVIALASYTARFEAGQTAPVNNTNVGGLFIASNATFRNIAGQFSSSNGSVSSSESYGIHASAGGATANYAIYGTTGGIFGSNTYAGYFDGDVARTGTDNFCSDRKLKENILDIDNATSILSQLKPRTFNFRTTEYPTMHLPSEKMYGLIAQEVQPILPEIISDNIHPAQYDEAGNKIADEIQYKGANYEALIPILIKGWQEQQSVIDSLKQRVSALENPPAPITNPDNHSNNSDMQSSISNRQSSMLKQNVPNPFKQNTTISYYLAETKGGAFIAIYDLSGRQIRKIDITTAGDGKVEIRGGELYAGIFMYSLVAGGNIIDTKKMVLTE